MTKETILTLQALGVSIAETIMGIVWFGLLTVVQFSWICGQCGKMNTTNFIKWALQWCDHRGHGV